MLNVYCTRLQTRKALKPLAVYFTTILASVVCMYVCNYVCMYVFIYFFLAAGRKSYDIFPELRLNKPNPAATHKINIETWITKKQNPDSAPHHHHSGQCCDGQVVSQVSVNLVEMGDNKTPLKTKGVQKIVTRGTNGIS